MAANNLWQRYCDHLYLDRGLGFTLDISRVRFDDQYFSRMKPKIEMALEKLRELEAGAIANPDENRMVGHYWLRNSSLAPSPEIAKQIEDTFSEIKDFSRAVHGGQLRGPNGPFDNLLIIGIGGSALGPQFIARSLGTTDDQLKPYFFDNTDPDGIDRTLAEIGDELERTLVLVISKSGGTPETRNGMLEAEAAFQRAGLPFAKHAVAITQEGSKLDQTAVKQGWLARFPMWDWVGGRTSVMSTVGLVPAALQGIDIDAFLAGAASMDEACRTRDFRRNPAALLALMWYHLGDGKGAKDMVILPYKDRLELFSRYLQQLVMESLGKELDRSGAKVHQGIAVYGNKGSTDQHAYVQQLRDGVPNFFATFIEVLRDRSQGSIEVEPGVTSGDFLNGFLLGTREALYDNGRDSITMTIEEVTPTSVGQLIALFERAVGLYAELVNINAYHQPGVEAGKKAAASVLALQAKIMNHMSTHPAAATAEQIAAAIGSSESVEMVYKILEHLGSNPGRNVRGSSGDSPATTLFRGEL